MTTPKVHGKALDKLIALLDPLIEPHFQQISLPSAQLPMGEITVCDLDFSGFYWPDAGEMRYTLLFGRERLQRLIKDETIVLFDGDRRVARLLCTSRRADVSETGWEFVVVNADKQALFGVIRRVGVSREQFTP